MDGTEDGIQRRSSKLALSRQCYLTLKKRPIRTQEESTPPSRLLQRLLVNLLEDDDGPHKRESAAASENAENFEENEQRHHDQRASLSEVREDEYDQLKERQNSAAS